jgi:hypothetical protein
LEIASGKPYAQLLQEYIFTPAALEAKELHVRKAELLHNGKDAEEARKIWLRLSESEVSV